MTTDLRPSRDRHSERMPSNPAPTPPDVSQEYGCEICHRGIPDGTGYFVGAGNRVGALHLCRLCFINVTKENN